MKTKNHIKLLKANWFLICLLLLLVNDFYLKFVFPGFLTGKLSDFSGLFIFPYFFSVFFIRQKKQIYFLTSFLFILWKLPVTSPLINWINDFDVIYLRRITDVTDLIAILILPVSYKYFNQQLVKGYTYNRFQVFTISLLAIFSFCATSVAEKEYPKPIFIGKAYKMNVNKELLLKKIKKESHFSVFEVNDTVFEISSPVDITIYDDSHRVFYSASIKGVHNDTTLVIVDSLIKFQMSGAFLSEPDEDTKKYLEKLSKTDCEIIFAYNFLRLLNGQTKEYRPMQFDAKHLGEN